jgi:hypothetical protein
VDPLGSEMEAGSFGGGYVADEDARATTLPSSVRIWT